MVTPLLLLLASTSRNERQRSVCPRACAQMQTSCLGLKHARARGRAEGLAFCPPSILSSDAACPLF